MQLAFCLVDNDKKFVPNGKSVKAPLVHSCYIKPDATVGRSAAAVHGITNEFLSNNSIESKLALERFISVPQAFKVTKPDGVVLVNGNSFDAPMISRDLRREYMDLPVLLSCSVSLLYALLIAKLIGQWP